MASTEFEIRLPAACKAILQRFESNGCHAYIVGGCVRDTLLGHEPHDWDIATDALPETVLTLFEDHPTFTTGLRHGTVTVLMDGEPYEITTFRVDGTYSDGRHPDRVTFTASIADDLARRDFTVNAMAYNETEGLVDPFNGRRDLERRTIRCVGNAAQRFSEDALRLLRAVRFSAQLGFTIEPDTLAAICTMHSALSQVAKERVFSELKKMLVGPCAADALRAAPGLLFSAVPQLACLRNVPQNSRYHCYDVWEHTLHALAAAPPDCTVRLAVLFHDAGKAACRVTGQDGRDHFYGHPDKSAEITEKALRALRCDNKTLREVVTLVRLHDTGFPMRPVKLRRLIASIGYELFYKLLDVARADSAAHAPEFVAPRLETLRAVQAEAEWLQKDDFCLTLRQLAVRGGDLYALGLRGREIGETLDRLLDEVICGQLPNDRERLLLRVKKHSDENKRPPQAGRKEQP